MDLLLSAFRSLRVHAAFSLLIILLLALGIGANTAIFGVVYAVLLKPLRATRVNPVDALRSE